MQAGASEAAPDEATDDAAPLSSAPASARRGFSWLGEDATNLRYNEAAVSQLTPVDPKRTTLHFTFGSNIMLDFVRNWLHFVRRVVKGARPPVPARPSAASTSLTIMPLREMGTSSSVTCAAGTLVIDGGSLTG